MSKNYDFPASDFIDKGDVEKLRTVWAHLTLLATGERPPQTNGEAAGLLAEAFYAIMGEEMQAPNVGVAPAVNKYAIVDEIIKRAEAEGLTTGQVASKLGIDGDRLNNGGIAGVIRLAVDDGDDAAWIEETLFG